MIYYQIFLNTLSILKTSRLAWLFGCFSILIVLTLRINSLYSASSAYVCLSGFLSIILLFLWITGQLGLIYITAQAMANRQTTIKQILVQVWSKLLRVFELVVMSIPLWICVFVANYFTSNHTLIPWVIFEVITSIVLFSITFGLCALIINRLKSHQAIWTGILITLHNLPPLLLISVGWLVARWGIMVFLYVIIFPGLQTSIVVPSLFDGAGMNAVANNPGVAPSMVLIDSFFQIFSTVYYTLYYLHLVQERAYPAPFISQGGSG